jgi:hypothetical protein
MTDPLKEAREQGLAAGVQIIADLVRTRDLDQCVSQIRLAAANDSKFNWHLLEAIASLAALGSELTDTNTK